MADLQLNPQEKLEVSYVIFIKVVMQILPNTYFQKNKINSMQQYLATSSIIYTSLAGASQVDNFLAKESLPTTKHHKDGSLE